MEQNPKRYSLLPAISYDGVLALIVLENSVKGKHFEHFIKYRVVSSFPPFPSKLLRNYS